MGAAAIVFGVSLVIILVIIAAVTLVWRNRVRRRRDETPGDRYRRAAQDIRRSGDGGHSGDPKIWPSSGGYDAGGGGA
jgi:hypothetical protein